jgi:hypothetical protein
MNDLDRAVAHSGEKSSADGSVGDELTGARERVEILSTRKHQPYRFKL